MGTATTKTETGLNCLATYTRYAWAYNSCGNSLQTTLTQSTLYCDFNCGSSITVNHIADTVAPVTKTVTYGTVNNIPGEPTKCWITSNLGADHQATSVDDATEASAGWYWQFNRKQGYKHDGTIRTPNTPWINNISESFDWIAANDPCNLELGSLWRLPTYTEWYNVDYTGDWTTFTGPWSSGLKMHAAGYLHSGDGSLIGRGSYGYYRSSTQADLGTAWRLYFANYTCYVQNDEKALTSVLRCLREN